MFLKVHSVSEYKKRYIRNSTQILENLRNAVVGFFGLRNKFLNVQRNKKRSTQNVFKLRSRKKYTHYVLYDKPKRSQRVDYSAMAKGHLAKKSK